MNELSHANLSHDDRTLYDCPACERPCSPDCEGRDVFCVGDHDADESELQSECGWCGEPIDYCQGHGELNAIDPEATVRFPFNSHWALTAAQYQTPGGHGAVFAAMASNAAVTAKEAIESIDREMAFWSHKSGMRRELNNLRAAVIREASE